MISQIPPNTHQQIAPISKALSSLSPLSSIVASVDDSIKKGLEASRDLWFVLLVVSTVLVFIGVVLEEAEGWAPYLKRLLPLTEIAQYRLVKKLAKLGWILIVVGVMGEGVFEVLVSRADSSLHQFDEAMLNEARRQAGDAAASAKTARDEVDEVSIKVGNAETTAGSALVKSAKANTASASALGLAHGAQIEADSVHQEIGTAKGELKQLEAEAQKTKSDLINLAVCNAPRVITSIFTNGIAGAKSYIDSLRPMAGQIVFIEVIPNDAEARRAALAIAQTLHDAQWNVQKPFLRFVEGIPDGVSVQPSVPSFTGSAKPNMSPHWHANDVAEKLLDFLHSYNWQAARGLPIDPQGKLIRDETVLPAGAIRIQVGLYPAAVYVSPPGQKELTSRMEEMGREREKTMAEYKRKREEHLATLPPELRKELEEADDEWKAKIKNATNNNPCQVLNPLF